MHKSIFTAVLVLFVTCMNGCATLGYYLQSVQGQFEVIHKRVPINTLLDTDTVPADTREKLALVVQLRAFASRELLLPDNQSYQYYSDLGRDFVVWNVFAAPELSLEGREWCFLIAGCLGYRGYFAEDEARKYATQLEQAGADVFVGGVTAYSTLGWFADPVLNTMIRHDADYLARVIFHELAHQKLFIKNDTEFNEAFADSVAEAGVLRWLKQTQAATQQSTLQEKLMREDEFTTLVLDYRQQLEELYESNLTDVEKRTRKQALLQQLRDEYTVLKQSWNNDTAYDAWFASGLNNAKLLAVATYRKYLPGFRQILDSVNHDLQTFYMRVAALSECGKEQRRAILLAGTTDFTC